MEKQGKKVYSVEKAMVLLDCFWHDRRGFSLAELAQKTGWAKSTIHALLSSMLGNSLVEQDPETGRYDLGYHAFELGCVVQERWDVRPVAAYYMRKITERTSESLYLGMHCGNDVLLVENSESYNNVHISSPLGSRMPLYCSSQGKIFLAHMSRPALQAYLKSTELKRYTPYTITDPDQLEKDLNMIRVQGYAVNNSELRTGTKSIAAPIFNPDGTCQYAIGVVTMAQGGMVGEHFQKLQDVVIQAAKDITQELHNPSGWKGL